MKESGPSRNEKEIEIRKEPGGYRVFDTPEAAEAHARSIQDAVTVVENIGKVATQRIESTLDSFAESSSGRAILESAKRQFGEFRTRTSLKINAKIEPLT